MFYGGCASAMLPLALHGKYYLTPCPKNEILRPLFNRQKYLFIEISGKQHTDHFNSDCIFYVQIYR